MDEFIARLNIEHFRQALAVECASERRQVLMRLLAEEESKLAAIERPSDPIEQPDPPAQNNVPVARLNLNYYRKRLVSEADPIIRQILMRLIQEEESSEAPSLAPSRKTCGDS